MASRFFLLLAACLLAVTGTLAVETTQGRALKQFIVQGDFAVQPSWPYCRCDDYAASSNPYTVTLTNRSVILNDGVAAGEFCFTFSYNGPTSDASECYSALEDRLEKFQVEIQPVCLPAFDVTKRYISVNGVRRKSGVEIKDVGQGAYLRVTKLGLNKDTANGAVVCMRLASPCDLPDNFFDTAPVTYSVMESSAHKCCVGAL